MAPKRFATPVPDWTDEEVGGVTTMQMIDEATSPEAGLWCAVILMAITDALGRGYGNNPPDRSVNRSTAADWLLSDRRDFRMVCDMAGVSAGSLRNKVRSILRRA
jgi:hypothetical protein